MCLVTQTAARKAFWPLSAVIRFICPDDIYWKFEAWPTKVSRLQESQENNHGILKLEVFLKNHLTKPSHLKDFFLKKLKKQTKNPKSMGSLFKVLSKSWNQNSDLLVSGLRTQAFSMPCWGSWGEGKAQEQLSFLPFFALSEKTFSDLLGFVSLVFYNKQSSTVYLFPIAFFILSVKKDAKISKENTEKCQASTHPQLPLPLPSGSDWNQFLLCPSRGILCGDNHWCTL